ncbi:hypothetical protein [Kordiimonas pumila]|uniref:Beta-carotene 15,15'-monooxygenase n=1 Tax=Kordiimonas pumila TaxID=2161677 RepID=A0ABV7D7Y7_9PROT|nr:hypothetical protein [Kordiimonas pumila]
MPTITSMLRYSLHIANIRLELLLMLSILSGIIASVVYKPATRILETALATLGASTNEENGVHSFTTALIENSGQLVIGYIGLLVATSCLLPFWARVCASPDLTPASGSFSENITRSAKACLYMLQATILTAVAASIGGTFIVTGVSFLGAAGSIIILFGALAILWLSLLLTSIAHIVICAVSIDKPLSFAAGWYQIKLFIRQGIGSLAIIWLSISVVNLLLSNLVAIYLPEETRLTVSLILNGAGMFLVSALHIGGLYSLPGVSETNT